MKYIFSSNLPFQSTVSENECISQCYSTIILQSVVAQIKNPQRRVLFQVNAQIVGTITGYTITKLKFIKKEIIFLS
jgi:hypothetical protein